MTARVIGESYEGGSVHVHIPVEGRLPYVSVAVFDAGAEVESVAWLTPAEAAELVAALNATLVELATHDPRPSASPVAEGRAQTDPHAVRTQRHGRGAASSHARAECSCGWRGELMPIKTVEGWTLADRDGERHAKATQTAPVGAGAASTEVEDTSLSATGGDARTTAAAGPSNPTAGSGRPAAPVDFSECGAPTPDGPCDLSASHPVGPMYPGHNGHMVSPELADALSAARDQLLASTPVGRNPNVCEHGYRFENALCPIETCGASAYVEPARPTLASMLGNARGELLANSTLIGPAGGEVR